MRVGTRGRGVLALCLLEYSVALCRAAMASIKKSCLLISVLLLLLVSTAHGARLVADAKDTGADDKRVTVRTGVAGHGHGYSSHRAHNPNGTPEGGTGGTPAVDPHNVATRGHQHHHRGAASRALSYSALATFILLGATFLVILV